MVLADRKSANAREVGVGQASFVRPDVELILNQLEVALGFDLVGHIEAGVTQAGDDVPRTDKSVPAEKPQQHLAGIAAEPAAALGQEFEQADLVGGRPPGEELAETAVLLRHILDQARIQAHRADLRAVAHDPRVLHEPVPEVVGLEGEPRRLEAEKSRFESGPLRFDHAPGEAGREHPPGHFREDAIIAELGERLRVRLRRHEPGERRGAAFALLGPGADGLERDHSLAAPASTLVNLQAGPALSQACKSLSCAVGCSAAIPTQPSPRLPKSCPCVTQGAARRLGSSKVSTLVAARACQPANGEDS